MPGDNGTSETPETNQVSHHGQAGVPEAQPAPAMVAPDFRVPFELMSQVLNYIGQGPWVNVNPLMAALHGCQPIKPNPEAPK